MKAGLNASMTEWWNALGPETIMRKCNSTLFYSFENMRRPKVELRCRNGR